MPKSSNSLFLRPPVRVRNITPALLRICLCSTEICKYPAHSQHSCSRTESPLARGIDVSHPGRAGAAGAALVQYGTVLARGKPRQRQQDRRTPHACRGLLWPGRPEPSLAWSNWCPHGFTPGQCSAAQSLASLSLVPVTPCEPCEPLYTSREPAGPSSAQNQARLASHLNYNHAPPFTSS